MIPFGKHLNIKSRTKDPTDKDLFTEVVGLVDECWIRSNVIENEFGLGILNYDEPFYLIIENLVYMHYGEWKGDIMLWWLFERFDEDGSVLPINLNDHAKETEEEIFIETVEELWEFIKKIESKSKL
jgi:hypothetical protein